MTLPNAPARYRPDWLMVGSLSLVLLAVVALPTVVGRLGETADLAYTGARWFSPQDTGVYYSWIRQAAEGEWLLSNRFTAEPQVLGTLNFYWVLVGKVAGLAHLPAWVAFALARLLCAFLLVLAVDAVASRLPTLQQRRWATLLAVLASGAGFVLLPWLSFAVDLSTGVPAVPVDLWVPEASLVHTAMHSGHLAAAAAGFTLAMASWAQALENRRLKTAVVAGLWAAFLFSFHPFEVVLIGSVVAASSVLVAWQERTASLWRLAAVWAAVASPPILYHVYTLLADPLIAARAAQNITLSPPLWTAPWALGLLGVLAAIGALYHWQHRTWHQPVTLVLLLWAALQLLLAYAPVLFQRRLLIGLPIALALLAAPVAAQAAGWVMRRLRPAAAGWTLLAFIFLVGFTPSTGWMLWHDLQFVANRHPLVYVQRDVLAAMQWLSEHTPKDAVVLALPEIGNGIPAWAGRITVVGHPIETVGAYEKARDARAYFDLSMQAEQRSIWLAQQRVTHVVAANPGFTKPDPGLQAVFSNSAVVIYAVEVP